MNIFSGNGLILCTAVLLTGAASANSVDRINTTSPTTNTAVQKLSYTAHGKTDRRTARIFQQLLKNNRNLQVHSQVIQHPARKTKRKVDVAVNYTIRGKTDMKTVRKLIKLFQTSKEVQISAIANVKANTAKQSPKTQEPEPQKDWDHGNASEPAYVYNGYPPAYYYDYGYNGYPPVYIQGNTMWVPVPVYNQPNPVNYVQTPQSAKPIMIAGK